ncbi:MAG: YbfB/YjiJ family MFS transporter [Pseudomonadales bacterium]
MAPADTSSHAAEIDLSPGARWTLGAGLTIAVAMGISRFAYTPLLPDMRSAFHWSLSQVGDLGSMNYLGYLIGALLAPRFLSARSIHRTLGLALLGCVLTTWLGAFTADYWAWCGIRLTSGIASAFCLVLVTAHLSGLLTAAQRPRLGNLHFTGVGLGIMASIFIIGSEATADPAIVAHHWQNLAAFSALLLLPAWGLFRSVQIGTAQATAPQTVTPFSRSLWRVIVGYGAFGFGYVVTATFIVAMGQEAATSAPASLNGSANQIWLVTGAAAVPSVWLWQQLAARWALAPTLALAYLVEAIGVVIAALGNSHWQLLLGGALLGGTFAAITALGLSLAQRLAPQQSGRAVGVMTAFFAVGQLVGPSIAARLAEFGGSFVLPSVVAAALLLVAAVLLWQPQGARTQSDTSTETG